MSEENKSGSASLMLMTLRQRKTKKKKEKTTTETMPVRRKTNLDPLLSCSLRSNKTNQINY